jgi:MYND finger
MPFHFFVSPLVRRFLIFSPFTFSFFFFSLDLSMATTTTSSSTADDKTNLTTLNARPTGIQWIETLELGYASDAAAETSADPQAKTDNDDDTICFFCQTGHVKLFRCSKCQVAAYCQKDCQVQDWKVGRHKHACDSYKRLGRYETFSNTIGDSSREQEAADSNKALARQDVFARIRLYACAYAVFKTRNLGRGFLFLQSQHTLAQMSLAIPKDVRGRDMSSSSSCRQAGPRAMLLHYLTLGEFDAELCRDDFEMAMLRTPLQRAVLQDYNDQTHVVLLWRFRCGHTALGIAPLTPDYGIALKLGLDYFGESDPPSLQLNIDDV